MKKEDFMRYHNQLIIAFFLTFPREIFLKNTTNFCKMKCLRRQNICCIYANGVIGRWCTERSQSIIIEDTDRESILHEMNTFRFLVASGTTNLDKLNKTTAADMHVLSYSKQLEYSAGCWARQCRLSRSRCRAVEGGRLGEIVCYEQHIDVDDSMLSEVATSMLQTCITGLVRQFSANFTHSMIDKLKLPVGGDDEINRSAVQMIWATTRYVGCYRIKYPAYQDSHMILLQVCHFFPAANVPLEPIFKRGEPATLCPADGDVNSRYTSLCGFIRPIEEDTWVASDTNIYPNKLTIILTIIPPLSFDLYV